VPPRCPACGRFLSTEVVNALAAGEPPCPACGRELTAAEVAAVSGPHAVERDVLAGWDAGVPPPNAVPVDRRPFPTDAAALATGAVGGSVIAVAARPAGASRGAAALLGALVGAGAIGAWRRVWRLAP
jgi:hypothetical protein